MMLNATRHISQAACATLWELLHQHLQVVDARHGKSHPQQLLAQGRQHLRVRQGTVRRTLGDAKIPSQNLLQHIQSQHLPQPSMLPRVTALWAGNLQLCLRPS